MRSKWFGTPQKFKYWPSMQWVWTVLRPELETARESTSNSPLTEDHKLCWLERKVQRQQAGERLGQFSTFVCCQLKPAAVTSPLEGRISTCPEFGSSAKVAGGARSGSRHQRPENSTRRERKSPQQEQGQPSEWNWSTEARNRKRAKIKPRTAVQTGPQRWWEQADYRAVEFNGRKGKASNQVAERRYDQTRWTDQGADGAAAAANVASKLIGVATLQGFWPTIRQT